MGQAIRVLHLDDDPSAGHLVRDALETQPRMFHLIEADSRQQFESKLANGDVDVVLSDFNHCGYEGLEVIDVVRRMRPGLPLIVVTGSGSEEVAVESIKRGAADYVVKSRGQIGRLSGTIWAALEKKALKDGRRRAEEGIDRIAWLCSTRISGEHGAAGQWMPAYGDLTELNSCRDIVDAVGRESLMEIGAEFIDLLGTSVAVLEKNGDYAAGMFSSSWCRYLDEASRRLCKTDDNARAIESGKWHCRESCWRDACSVTIRSNREADIACRGGIRLCAVPIRASDEAVGAICIGYGDPPTDDDSLRKIADTFDVEFDGLRARAAAYHSRPQYIVDLAKKRLSSAARLIGEIVERKRTQDELVASEQRYRTLFNDALDMIHVVDCEGRIVDANRVELETLGYSREEYIGTRLLDAIHPDSRQACADQLKSVFEGKPIRAFENALLTKGGEKVPVEVNAFPQIVDGTVVSARAIIRNMTVRKQVEDNLRVQQERAQRYLDIAGVAFVALDTEGKVRLLNRRGEELLGYSAGELLGRDWFDTCLPERLRAPVRRVFERLTAGDLAPVEYYENPILTKSGDERIVAWHNTLVRDPDGEIVGTLSSGEDITDRKKSEQSLRESERSLANAQRLARLGNWVWDVRTGEVEWSDEVYRIFGLDPREFHPDIDSVMNRFHPEDRILNDEVMAQAVVEGQQYSFDARILLPGGAVRFLNSTSEGQYDEDGKLTRISGTVQDVTERRLAEEALRESEQRFRAIFEQAAVGVAQIETKTGRFVRVNRRYCQIVGLEPEEMTATTFMAITHPEDLQEDLDNMEKLKNGEIRDFSMEKRYFQKDGSVVWVHLSVSPMWDVGEEPTHHIAVVENVTDRKTAEEEVESLARFPSENPHPVLRTAIDSSVLYANAAAGPLLTCSGGGIGDLAPREWRQLTTDAVVNDDRRQIDVVHGDRIFSFIIVPVSAEGYANWYGRDVTERRRAVEQAQQAQRELLDQQRRETERIEAELERAREELVRQTRLAAIGQVSASIAHELRNPLGSVRNAVYYLKRHTTKEDATVAEFLDVIDDEVSASDRIIGDLLEMTRAKAAAKRRFDLAELVNEVCFRAKDAEQISCRIDAEPDPFEVHADPDQLRQVIVNLVDNAVQAMGGRGQLHVHMARGNDCDIVSFCDTGPGIPLDARESVFEPLVTTKAKGVGLGLTICRQIIEGHGGTIDVVDHEGGGAAFRVRLPR